MHQRLALGSKGEAVDILVMTATPIPRTLALTYFGDMDVSVLNEKPAGRKPIATRLVSSDRIDEVVGRWAGRIAAGDLVYWVCPLVGESETLDLAAAEERFDRSAKASSATRSASSTASSPGATRTPRWSASPVARRRSWSRPR